MRIRIGEKTSYQDSLLWKIQDNFYREKGKNSWKEGHVPFNISCNSRAAFQNAQVVFEAVKSSRASDSEQIFILEMGAGSGIFSLNFLKEFRQICLDKQENFFENIHYMITDYAKTIVTDISEIYELKLLESDGKVGFYVMDILYPENIKNLKDETFPLKPGMLTATIANYLHSNLQIASLKKIKDIYSEKTIQLFYEVDDSVKDIETFIKNLIEHPTDSEVLKKLERVISYEKIDLKSYIPDQTERKTITDYIKNYKNAEITYPVNSFKSIGNIIPFINKNGILLISDKSYGREEKFLGKENEDVLHFNSFSHTVNLPLFGRYAENLGACWLRTVNPSISFHTLLIVNSGSMPENIKYAFESLFIIENINNLIFEDYKIAKFYLQHNDYKNSITYFLKVMDLLPEDPWVLYNLGLCFFSSSDFKNSVSFLTEGKKHDHFKFLDFDLLLGLCLINFQQFSQAREYFEKSLEYHGATDKVLFSIGLCWQYQGETAKAKEYFEKALMLNPKFENARISLNLLS